MQTIIGGQKLAMETTLLVGKQGIASVAGPTTQVVEDAFTA
jgi:hypothetical protein